MNCTIKSPIITATLAAGSTASPYYCQVNITQELCAAACAEDAPVFNPRFSLVGIAMVATGQYVATIHVEGIISYVRCGGGCECTMQQPLSTNFTVPIAKSTTPTAIALSAGAAVNTIAVAGCQQCSKTFVSETPLTITVS